MATILDTIVEATRALVAARKTTRSVRELERLTRYDRKPLDLATALRGPELAILAECKKASPSRGVIRSEYDPASIAVSYERAGAAAISVLTEPSFFQGSLEDLAAVRDRVAIPILRKDFVIDEYQLVEARAFGADAVLLIAAVLDRRQLCDLHDAAADLGLSCLVECYDASELERVDFDRVRVLGVNNRNLHTFEVDRSHAPRVLSRVPDHVVRVAESGMRTASDFASMRRAGLDAVLVGETFMRAQDPGAELARLVGETSRLIDQIVGP